MGSVWDKAKDRLSAPDRVLFDTDRDDKRAILNDILQAVQKQNDECLRRRWKIKGLNGKEIFLRDLGVSDTHVFENLVEGLEIVARVVARYSIFEEIYLTAASKAQQHLTEQLVELYAAILRYLCSAKKYYDRNTASKSRMIVTALRPPELDDAILHITKEEESVRRQADLVDAENTYNTVEASVSGILELKSKLHSLEAPFIRTVAQLSDIQDHMDST
ncbi:hypothetical protein D6C99_02410 [Aureobasidium pullulans]|nr:hypothetical protein D6C99_02410 [Aureobasidium pullulans]